LSGHVKIGQISFRFCDIWDKFPFMENSGVKYVLGAMARLLRPLVKLLLEKGISYDQAADVLRKTYCDVAFTDAFALPGRKQTDSRVSVLTGLTRKDVARLKEMTLESPGLMANHNRATRVATGWWLDHPDAAAASGVKALPLEGDGPSFATLVRKFSGDMPVRAVLDELLRLKAVTFDGSIVELVRHNYVPDGSEVNKIEYLGTDVADLISTISHNLRAGPSDALLQRRMFSDNVPAELVSELHKQLVGMAVPTLDEAKRTLALYDRDTNPLLSGVGRKRVTFGVYFSSADYDEAEWLGVQSKKTGTGSVPSVPSEPKKLGEENEN
jgi:Family of unknown function (DUF6502)